MIVIAPHNSTYKLHSIEWLVENEKLLDEKKVLNFLANKRYLPDTLCPYLLHGVQFFSISINLEIVIVVDFVSTNGGMSYDIILTGEHVTRDLLDVLGDSFRIRIDSTINEARLKIKEAESDIQKAEKIKQAFEARFNKTLTKSDPPEPIVLKKKEGGK